jgi:hypothetical protein
MAKHEEMAVYQRYAVSTEEKGRGSRIDRQKSETLARYSFGFFARRATIIFRCIQIRLIQE